MGNRTFFTLALGLAFVFPAFADSEPTPVLVELFTSQGCSSCPPADRFLQELAKQPVDGVEIIPVSWHVDYWNRLGWTDPYSSETASARQYMYQRKFKARSVYTPQMIVDGKTEFVGSNKDRGLAAIKSAAKQVKVSLAIVVENRDGAVSVAAKPDRSDESWDATLLLTEDHVETDVKRGENSGRTLHHTAVVRASSPMKVNDSGAWDQTLTPPDDAGDLDVVVILQDKSGQVVAATEQPVSGQRYAVTFAFTPTD